MARRTGAGSVGVRPAEAGDLCRQQGLDLGDGGIEVVDPALDGRGAVGPTHEAEDHAVDGPAGCPTEGEGVGGALVPVAGDLGIEVGIVGEGVGLVVEDREAVGAVFGRARE